MKTQASLPGMADLKTTRKGRKVQVRHVDPDPVAAAPPDAICLGTFATHLTEGAMRDAARLHRVKLNRLDAHSTTTAVEVVGEKAGVMALVLEMKGRRMLVRDQWSVTLRGGAKR